MISPVGMPYPGVHHPKQITSNQSQGFGTSSFSDIFKSLSSETTAAHDEMDAEPIYTLNSFNSNNRISVYRANDMDENSYIVSGNNQGRDFRTTININNVNPAYASLIEMLALQSHLQVKDGINSLPLQPMLVDTNGNHTEPNYFKKMDFMSLLKGLSEGNTSNTNQEYRINSDKLISALKPFSERFNIVR